LASKDSPRTTIADALSNDTPPLPKNDIAVSAATSSGSDSDRILPVISAEAKSLSVNPPVVPPKKSAFSPALIKKIVEQAGRNSTNISIELERFLIKQFGFSTQELSEDDPDVEMVKLGWDCLWQSYLENREPPVSLILAFGYSCITVRLIATAKRIPKKEESKDAGQTD
jgi:hypothetical protein